MKLAHLADLHLGFRQYEAHTPKGANQREADVALAVHRALDGVIAAQPEAVVVAGDVFHSVRPSNGAILTAFAELGRLRAALPEVPVLLLAGDHDTPRSSEAGSILGLYRALGCTVVEREVTLVEWPGAKVLAVPKAAARALKGYGGERGDVLVLHGEVRHLPGADAEAAALEGWGYVALGHYHVCHRVAPRAWYSGSVDYTSTDPWSELEAEAGRGKGWLLADTRAGTVQWQPVAAPRAFYDLGTVDGTDCSAAEVDQRLATALAGPLDGAVARLQVRGVTRETQHALDYKAIQAAKARALHLQLTFQRPVHGAVATVAGLPKRMPKLEEVVAAFLADRTLPPDVDRAELVREAQGYLKAAP